MVKFITDYYDPGDYWNPPEGDGHYIVELENGAELEEGETFYTDDEGNCLEYDELEDALLENTECTKKGDIWYDEEKQESSFDDLIAQFFTKHTVGDDYCQEVAVVEDD